MWKVGDKWIRFSIHGVEFGEVTEIIAGGPCGRTYCRFDPPVLIDMEYEREFVMIGEELFKYAQSHDWKVEEFSAEQYRAVEELHQIWMARQVG